MFLLGTFRSCSYYEVEEDIDLEILLLFAIAYVLPASLSPLFGLFPAQFRNCFIHGVGVDAVVKRLEGPTLSECLG